MESKALNIIGIFHNDDEARDLLLSHHRQVGDLFLVASRVANAALRELGVVLLLLLVKTKPFGLGSFIHWIRISLNTKHSYTSSH